MTHCERVTNKYLFITTERKVENLIIFSAIIYNNNDVGFLLGQVTHENKSYF